MGAPVAPIRPKTYRRGTTNSLGFPVMGVLAGGRGHTDAVVYAWDPGTHLQELDHPLAVVLHGRRIG
jgi:hypothetical protein